MAVDQKGTGSLTAAGQATAAAVYITVPTGAIVESVTKSGGTPQYEDVYDEDGAFHTRLTFESGMDGATIVIVGVAYASSPGDVDGSSSNYYVEDVQEEKVKGALRTTIRVTRIPTIA